MPEEKLSAFSRSFGRCRNWLSLQPCGMCCYDVLWCVESVEIKEASHQSANGRSSERCATARIESAGRDGIVVDIFLISWDDFIPYLRLHLKLEYHVCAGVHRYRALDPPAEGRGCIYVLQIKSLSQIRHAAYNMLALFSVRSRYDMQPYHRLALHSVRSTLINLDH
jgi:hypothetical protein